MAELHVVFTGALQGLWGPDYWVTWPPGLQLALGDVGIVRHGRLTPTSRLAERDIEVDIDVAGGLRELAYDSEGAVSVTFKAAGESPDGFQALARADAGACVRFARENAVLAVYTELRETRIRRLGELAEQLTRRFWEGTWSASEAVVSSLVTARSATVLVGIGSQSRAELRAGASVATLASLGSLAADVGIVHRDRLALALSGPDVTPFFRLVRLRRSFTGRIEQEYGRGLADAPAKMPARVIEEALQDPEGVVEELCPPATSDGAGS
ncbi:MAG TPA: hypothetical protein VOB72_18515 [Candidatus Dormibacteraeota bacterium]|nr:hypothetical protein [Candidatus Dormibacteraeota bacterium]